MNRILTVCLIVFGLALSTGCATIFTGGRGSVSATSNPSGAEVLVNGEPMGQTPCSLVLKTKGEYVITIQKEGYKPQKFQLTNKVGAGWIILDVLGGLVPVIVDAATGAWYTFNEQNFNAELEKNAPFPVPQA